MSERPPTSEPERKPVKYQINVPEEEKDGRYANILAVWHSRHEFTLDFSVTGVPEEPDPKDPGSPLVVPCNVVARLKIPPTVILEVLRALSDNLTTFEEQYGEILELTHLVT